MKMRVQILSALELAKLILQVSIQNLTILCGARIFKLLSTHDFDSTEPIPCENSAEDCFLETSIQCEGTEDL
jgi:hypothetical protein